MRNYIIRYKNMLIITAALLCALTVLLLLRQPSNDREWSLDQSILPEISMSEGAVTIKNIRNFTYKTKDIYVPSYYDKTFKITDVTSVDYIVEPFSGVGAAHTFLSFGLQDGSYIAISIEIRKELGETFSPLKGLLRSYELSYVIADERDVISLRANYRNNNVYLYPLNLNSEQSQKLLMSMLKRANEIGKEPEFYNTITNTCATNIASHLSEVLDQDIHWDWRLIFPSHSDVFARELGLITYDGDIGAMREHFKINDKALSYREEPNFSNLIREDR